MNAKSCTCEYCVHLATVLNFLALEVSVKSGIIEALQPMFLVSLFYIHVIISF